MQNFSNCSLLVFLIS